MKMLCTVRPRKAISYGFVSQKSVIRSRCGSIWSWIEILFVLPAPMDEATQQKSNMEDTL